MGLVSQLTPTNLIEEKEKFFHDEIYNPQFIYSQKIDDQVLTRYGLPQNRYLDLAQTILDQAYYNRSEAQLEEKKGPAVTQEEVAQKVTQFLDMHGLKERFKISWSSSFVARTTITTNTIKLRLPVDFRKLSLLGMLYHEIGTHALRRINYEQQPWYQKKTELGFNNYLKTEEGLATLHSILPLDFKLAYYPALNYVAVDYAQKHSFAQLWQFLKRYIDDPEKRWRKTLRLKRGIDDTANPGGFTKDLVYFEGMIDVWNYLKKNKFDVTKLYFGKMALEDADKAFEMNPDFKPVLPSFFVVDQDEYVYKLSKIGVENQLL